MPRLRSITGDVIRAAGRCCERRVRKSQRTGRTILVEGICCGCTVNPDVSPFEAAVVDSNNPGAGREVRGMYAFEPCAASTVLLGVARHAGQLLPRELRAKGHRRRGLQEAPGLCACRRLVGVIVASLPCDLVRRTSSSSSSDHCSGEQDTAGRVYTSVTRGRFRAPSSGCCKEDS